VRPITNHMIKVYGLDKQGFDFMGYTFKNKNELSFHHLVVARQLCKEFGLGDGYQQWNGAILKQLTSHDYLHLIQRIDEEIFYRITCEMLDENLKGRLDLNNLKRIRDLLTYFEKEHCADTDREGRKLIKERFITDRIRL